MSKETTQALRKKLKLLETITQTISYNLNIDEVLAEIVNLISDNMKVDSCLIYLNQDNKNLILKASKIPHPRMINKTAMKIGQGITGWAAAKQKIVAISKKAYQDKRFLVIPNLDEDKWEAFLSVPIIFQKNIIGVINIQHRKPKKYSKQEVKLLEAIASQVGGAISNAKLISETRALKNALETRKVLEKAKGLLMKNKNISEEEAYKIIRKKSMDSKKTIKDIAEAIMLILEN